MNFIEQRFALLEEQFPLDSSFVIYAKTIQGQSIPKNDVTKWFFKLVNKADYEPKDIDKLIEWLLNYMFTKDTI